MGASRGLGLEAEFRHCFSFISCVVHRDLGFNIITSIKSGDFTGLGSLTILSVLVSLAVELLLH
jgi:hypothetical protein